MKIVPDDSPEARRGQSLADLEAGGVPWRPMYEPGSYGCHELLDRLELIANSLDDWVVSHPSCLMNAEWFASAASALDMLRDLYDRVADAHLDGKDRPQPGGWRRGKMS